MQKTGGSDVSQQRTTVQKDTQNPHWDEGPFLFTIDSLEGMLLHLSVKDEDQFGKDDMMGKCEIDLNDLSQGPLTETPVELCEVVDGNMFTTDGKLYFKVSWHPDE